MRRLIDNRNLGTVFDALVSTIMRRGDLRLLTQDFSLAAYQALERSLGSADAAHMIIPGGTGEDGAWTVQVNLAGTAAERRFRNTLLLPAVARRLRDWLSQKTEVKLSGTPITQNLIHIRSGESSDTVIHGSSPLTAGGLGLVPSDSFHMNTYADDPQETGALREWFEQIWSSPAGLVDGKDLLLNEVHRYFEPHPPVLPYYLTLYHLFGDSLDEIDEERIIKTRTGIKETRVWKKLYRFQRDGVLAAIDKIEKYNGCIIADSVGLGKTFEALAIIKYYELRNDRVLVLCPKKLRENWTIYTANDVRNSLAEDRFNYDVLNHTDLTRDQGMSGDINLETINWGNYDLIVIDESHNFRNNPPRKDGLTRYSRLMQEIIRKGVKTKVLMLSATPVNNRMNDLKNQVAFITEGEDDALYEEEIGSIEQTLRKAQTRFNVWLKTAPEQRSAQSLLDALNFDYFKLLDLLTIARSRKHIAKYYDLSEVGPFPKRLPPINVKADIDTADQFPELRQINRDIRRLNLSAYAPLKYVLPDKLEAYGRKYDMTVSGGSVFKQIDREESLIHLMRVNLFKRMESSIHSFGLTIERLLNDVRSIIERIENHQDSVEELRIEDVELEDDSFDPYLVGNKVKVLIQDMDRIRWQQELREDEELLVKLLRQARDVTVNRDEKLRRLKEEIDAKCATPINDGNRKVIVFTAFADTAKYLYEHLSSWSREQIGLHSALVTGGTDANKTTVPELRRDIASILGAFSPISKERAEENGADAPEIDLLISTDCLSEGQNLQDCDYLVNYDIHWNPVRIIQRFGRIDRLGSRNTSIQLVNFWPNMELDEYINLETRVSGRMVLLDISATGEENIIEYDSAERMNDLEYRRRQLEQLQHEVIDIEDLSNGISITDLTLSDFKIDLLEYLKEHTESVASTPLGAFAVATSDELVRNENLAPGVIFCLQSDNQKVRVDSTYALSPYYLVYVTDQGEVRLNFSQTRQILDVFKKLTLGRQSVDENGYARFNERTANGTDMGSYQKLLATAVTAITGRAEEKGIESLFERGGTAISKDSFRGIDDFEVITYLIIYDEEAVRG